MTRRHDEMGRETSTVGDYIAELPEDRRSSIEALRIVVLDNLPPGYEEGMAFGMIGYYVPLARYPHTYTGQPLLCAALASQKRHMAIHLLSVYGDDWFRASYAQPGKRLDMGKSRVRFTRLENLALEVVAAAVRRVSVDEFARRYEASHCR